MEGPWELFQSQEDGPWKLFQTQGIPQDAELSAAMARSEEERANRASVAQQAGLRAPSMNVRLNDGTVIRAPIGDDARRDFVASAQQARREQLDRQAERLRQVAESIDSPRRMADPAFQLMSKLYGSFGTMAREGGELSDALIGLKGGKTAAGAWGNLANTVLGATVAGQLAGMGADERLREGNLANAERGGGTRLFRAIGDTVAMPLDALSGVFEDATTAAAKFERGQNQWGVRTDANGHPIGSAWNPANWTLGDSPTLLGQVNQFAGAVGSSLPALSPAVLKSPALSVAVGGGMGATSNAEQAEQEIDAAWQSGALQGTDAFHRLVAQGHKPEDVYRALRESAGQGAAISSFIPAGVGGLITQKVFGPIEGAALRTGASRALTTAGRVGLGALGEPAEEGFEQFSANVGADRATGLPGDPQRGVAENIIGALPFGVMGAGRAAHHAAGGNVAEAFQVLGDPNLPAQQRAEAALYLALDGYQVNPDDVQVNPAQAPAVNPPITPPSVPNAAPRSELGGDAEGRRARAEANLATAANVLRLPPTLGDPAPGAAPAIAPASTPNSAPRAELGASLGELGRPAPVLNTAVLDAALGTPEPVLDTAALNAALGEPSTPAVTPIDFAALARRRGLGSPAQVSTASNVKPAESAETRASAAAQSPSLQTTVAPAANPVAQAQSDTTQEGDQEAPQAAPVGVNPSPTAQASVPATQGGGIKSPVHLQHYGKDVAPADLVKMKDVYGKTVYIHKDALADESATQLPMYTSSGKPNRKAGRHQTIHRENLDADGSKRSAMPGLPYYADTTRNGEKPFKTAKQAEKAVTEAGQRLDDYEIKEHNGGFVAVRKAAESAVESKTEARPTESGAVAPHTDTGEAPQPVSGSGLAATQTADSPPSPQGTPVEGGGGSDAATAIRSAFQSATATGYSIGDSVPVSVTVNGRTRDFIARQKSLSNGKKPAPIELRTVEFKRLIAGNAPEWVTNTYKLDGNGDLKEVGLARPATDYERKFGESKPASAPAPQAQAAEQPKKPSSKMTAKELREAEKAKAAATHADPGEAPEAVTPAVIADAAKTADRAPTVSMAEARKVLLAKLDAAIKAAPNEGVLDNPPTTKASKNNGRKAWEVNIGRTLDNGLKVPALTIAESHDGNTYSIGIGGKVLPVGHKDNTLAKEGSLLAARLTAARMQQGAEWAANGKNGGWTFTPVAPVENITIDVPGDGTFKVRNTKERLTAFRKQVESFFKLPKHETPKPESLTVSQATRDKIMAEAETVDDAAPPAQTEADRADLDRRADALLPVIDALTNVQAKQAAESIGGMKASDRRDPKEYLRNQHPDDVEAALKAVQPAPSADRGEVLESVEELPEGQELVALHNLDESNLLFADKLGGIPVPSIGITKASTPFDGFGSISLIGRTGLATPGSDNPVFSSDAYTARFPDLVWDKVPTKRAEEFMASFGEPYGERDFQNTWDYLVNRPDRDRAINEAVRGRTLMKAWLKEQGEVPVAPVMEKNEPSSVVAWAAMDSFIAKAREIIAAGGRNLHPDDSQWKDLSAAALVAVKEKIEADVQKAGEDMDKSSIRIYRKMITDSYMSNAFDDDGMLHFARGERALDYVASMDAEPRQDNYATRLALQNQIGERKPEFEDWVAEKINSLFAPPSIKLGGRKVPMNLENVVEAMASRKVRGREKSMTFGGGQVAAANSKQFKSLAEIKKARDSIVSEEEHRAAKDGTEKLLDAYRNLALPYYTITNYRGEVDTWNGLDDSMRALAAAAKKAPTIAAIRSGLARNNFDVSAMDPEVFEAGVDALKAVRQTVVDYFEAKPQRAVQLSEFAGAVIPAKTSEAARSLLAKAGVRVMEYDGTPNSRRDAIAKLSRELHAENGDVLFQQEAQDVDPADLTPAQRASFDRQSIDRKGQRYSIQQGSDDADAMGMREAVRAVIGDIPVTFLRGLEGLPTRLRNGLERKLAQRGGKGRTAGLFDPKTGTVYLFTDALKSPELAAFTAAHEIAGHKGLRALLGDKLNKVLDLAEQNPTVKAVAASMTRQRNLRPDQRYLAIEEALADIAASNRTQNWTRIADKHGVEVPKSMQSKLRAMLDNIVARIKALFGKQGVAFTDAQVLNLLENAWQAARGDSAIGHPESALESVEDVRDEAAAREGDDGFSEEGRRQAYDGLEPVSDDSAPAADERASMPPVGPVVDLPSRRPGESQQDYTRRISRRGGSELRAINAEMARMRKIGRANFRAMLAKQARMADVADAVFHEYRTLFDKADRAALLEGIDQWETGRAVTDPDLRNFFSLMDGLFAERIERLRAAKPDALKELVENYFPHIWEDTGKAEQWYSANTKRPLDGNKSFLKQRTWGTIREGMASGLRPVSYNPVDLALLKLGQMDKFITFHEFKNDLKARGWLKQVKAGERLPEGYALIDSPAFKGSHAFVVKGDDGGADHAGTSHWNWAVPELIAKDVNNYLSPSLYRFGAWKALRYVQNVLMSTRLGFSMFHAGFTTLDNAVTHGSIGLNRLLQGDVVGAAKEFAYIPLSPLVAPYHGGQLNKMWRGKVMADPHTQALLLALEEGGARRLQTSHQQDFNNALNSIARKLRRLRAPGLVRDTEAGVRAMLEGPKSDAARAVGNAAVKQAAELIGAVGELSSWLIHQKLVPAQKMNARVSLLKFELDRLATKLGKDRGDYKGIIEAMHPDVLRQVAGRVVDNVDDRLGQMNYDNQFWPKVAREIAQATIGAVGWQVGTVRTVTGGVRDLQRLVKPESLVATLDKEGRITDANMGRLTNRVTNLLVLGALMSAASVIAQMAMTGDPPEEPKDFFFPRTGRKNRDDSDERLQFPTYWMDHYKLATHPLQTAGHKVHPSIGMALETFANKDYYGVEIRDEDAPLPTQATQIAEYFAKGFVPYSITGQGKLTENDAGLAARVGNFFGFTVAPASVSRSEFQAFVADKAADTAPRGARTQAQADKSEHMREVESELRRGESPDLSGLTERQLRDARRAAGMQVPEIRFMRLSLEDKLRGWDMATPEERARYHLRDRIVGKDREKDIARLPEGDREYVRRRLEEIRASAPDDR